MGNLPTTAYLCAQVALEAARGLVQVQRVRGQMIRANSDIVQLLLRIEVGYVVYGYCSWLGTFRNWVIFSGFALLECIL